MLFSKLLTVSGLVSQTLALGINCQGSALCGLATIENHGGTTILQLWHDVLQFTTMPNDTMYGSDEKVMCLGTNVNITFGASGDASGQVVSAGLTVSSSITFGNGGVCLFPQGAALTLDQMRPLVDALGEHGCGACGSVPIFFTSTGDNDPSHGILTSNYVGNIFCDDNCITTIPTIPGSLF